MGRRQMTALLLAWAVLATGVAVYYRLELWQWGRIYNFGKDAKNRHAGEYWEIGAIHQYIDCDQGLDNTLILPADEVGDTFLPKLDNGTPVYIRLNTRSAPGGSSP